MKRSKKYRGMFRLIELLLVAVMMLAVLASCGGSQKDDPNLGLYKLSKMGDYDLKTFADMMKISEEEASNFMTFELKSDGTIEVVIKEDDGEDRESGKWEINGDKITISDSTDSKMEGTVKDGVMTLDMEGETVVLKRAS